MLLVKSLDTEGSENVSLKVKENIRGIIKATVEAYVNQGNYK